VAAVGIRELRHDASALIRRVEAGETIDVTVQGRPAARLVPVANPDGGRRSMKGSVFLSRLGHLEADDTGWLEELREWRASQTVSDPWERE
jgi:prevent-host-death family protein